MIDHQVELHLSPDEFTELLTRSTRGDRRRVGLARSLTDLNALSRWTWT